MGYKKNEPHKDIPLSTWYSEGILIAKPEEPIQNRDPDDYSDVKISLERATNKKYSIDSLWIDNVKGIEFCCCNEDHYDVVVLLNDKIIVDGDGTNDKRGRVISTAVGGRHQINVWNNIDKKYEYFNREIKGKYPTKEEYKKYLWDRSIVR